MAAVKANRLYLSVECLDERSTPSHVHVAVPEPAIDSPAVQHVAANAPHAALEPAITFVYGTLG